MTFPSPTSHTKTQASSAPGPNFSELWKVVRYRKSLLFTLTALAVFGGMVKQIFYVPTFTAQTQLVVQKIENSPLQVALANLGAANYDSTDRLKRYTEYLQSESFFLAVAERLKFQDGFHLLNFTSPADMSIGTRRFWRHYLATHFGRKDLAPTSSEDLEPVLIPVEKIASILSGFLQAEAIGTETLRIRATSLDPLTSMILANTAAEVFVKKTSERDYNEVNQVKIFIRDQLEQTTDRLKKSESTLIEFKRKHNIVSITSQQASFSSRMTQIETELEGAKIKLQENSRLGEYYEKAIARREAVLMNRGSSALREDNAIVINRLRQQLDTLQYKKVLMQSQGYNEQAWQMTELNREIDETANTLKQKLTEQGQPPTDGTQTAAESGAVIVSMEQARGKIEALREESKGLEVRIATLAKTRESLLGGLESLPRDEQVLLTLSRDVDLQFELYSNLKKKLQEVEIQQVALQSNVIVSERSGMPGPVARTHFLIKLLFSLLVGIFIGCSTAVALEAIDPTVKHLHDLGRLDLPVLGTIPHVHGSPLREAIPNATYRPDLLVCREKPEGREGMAFKSIRTRISLGELGQVVTVTSPERGDGKSFIAANLATCFAQLEKRVLLIDCDFRNPSVPHFFGYADADGLSEVLTLKQEIDSVIRHDQAPRLDVLPAGHTPRHPTELLSGEKFEMLIEHLRQKYDYIFLDAPPVLAVIDACVLAHVSDAVLVGASYRKTRKGSYFEAVKKVLSVSHKPVMAILNNVWELEDFQIEPAAAEETFDSLPAGDPKRQEIERFAESLARSRKAG